MDREKFLEAARTLRDAREGLIYKIAWAKAALKAPKGRYKEEDLALIREKLAEVEAQFPDLWRSHGESYE